MMKAQILIQLLKISLVQIQQIKPINAQKKSNQLEANFQRIKPKQLVQKFKIIIYINQNLGLIVGSKNKRIIMKKKGKGLSFDQKRERMLGIFHKNKDVYNYQEVQKLSTSVGIPFPSVKQILQSLKADSLVQCQKIGAGVFYWSFPSRAYQTIKDRLEITKKQIISLEQQIQSLQKNIQEQKVGRQETQKREQLNKQLGQLTEQKEYQEKQIQKLIRFDPQRYELLLKENKQLKLTINTQIDNLEQIRKYIKKNQVGITDQDIDQNYGIPVQVPYYQ